MPGAKSHDAARPNRERLVDGLVVLLDRTVVDFVDGAAVSGDGDGASTFQGISRAESSMLPPSVQENTRHIKASVTRGHPSIEADLHEYRTAGTTRPSTFVLESISQNLA